MVYAYSEDAQEKLLRGKTIREQYGIVWCLKKNKNKRLEIHVSIDLAEFFLPNCIPQDQNSSKGLGLF